MVHPFFPNPDAVIVDENQRLLKAKTEIKKLGS